MQESYILEESFIVLINSTGVSKCLDLNKFLKESLSLLFLQNFHFMIRIA